VVTGYALAGGAVALAPLKTASGYISENSVWDVVGDQGHLAHLPAPVVWIPVAMVIVAIAIGWRRRDDPVAVTIATALAYLLAAPYALPWYSGWLLPSVALTWRSRLAVMATVYPALALLVYNNRPVMAPEVREWLLRIRSDVLPVVELAALLALVVLAWRRRQATEVFVPR
jgi:hypothetical protein